MTHTTNPTNTTGVPAARLLGLKEEVPVIMERIDEQLYGCSYMVGHPGRLGRNGLMYTGWN